MDCYEATNATLIDLLTSLEVLAGDLPSIAGHAWQDVARIAAGEARQLADLLDAAADGRIPGACFPSPAEALERVDSAG